MLLVCFLPLFRISCDCFGLSWCFSAFRCALGAILAPTWLLLVLLGTLGVCLGTLFGVTWGLLGLSWPLLGLSWTSLGAFLSLLGHARELSWKEIALGLLVCYFCSTFWTPKVIPKPNFFEQFTGSVFDSLLWRPFVLSIPPRCQNANALDA